MGRPKRVKKKVDYSQFADDDVAMSVESDEEFKDLVMDDAVDDADDVVVDDADAEVEPKKKGRKPKPKAEPKPKKPAKKDIKNNRNLSSLKEKFFRIFGYNNDKLVELVEQRAQWDEPMFQFNDDLLKEPQAVPSVELPVVEYNTLTQVDLSRKFPLQRESVTLQMSDEDAQLIKPDEELRDGNLHIMNTNALITDLAWLPTEDSNDYIALSVSNITDTTNHSNFSIMARNTYTSGFYIYEFNAETGDLKLSKILIHDWGNSWDLKWIKSSSSKLGALCAVFNDGNARILSLPNNGPDIIELKRASLEYHLTDHMITCMDVTVDRVIAGTDTGHLAEFTLGDPAPSYIYPLHTSYVLSVKASTSQYDETVVYTACADGTNALCALDDITTSINRSAKSKHISKLCYYSPQTHSFVQTDGTNSAQAIPIRASFVASSLVSHDGSIESIGISSLHPMMLSGGSDGRIKINSISRRLLNGQKVAMTSHRVLTLLELQYGKLEDTYRLVRNYQVESPTAYDNTGFLNVYPSNVSFSSVSWNENLKSGKWFATATTSGLLFVDKL